MFREAKFCTVPDDEEVSISPLVAQLYERLIQAIIESDVVADGAEARNRWASWLEMDPGRDEWGAALVRAQREPSWDELDAAGRREFVETLFRPFKLSEIGMDDFISATISLRRRHD